MIRGVGDISGAAAHAEGAADGATTAVPMGSGTTGAGSGKTVGTRLPTLTRLP